MARPNRINEGHLKGILAHWPRGLTPDFMQGIKSLSSAVKLRAGEYRSVEYMTAILDSVVEKLPCGNTNPLKPAGNQKFIC
jgi:hypothetical protein